MDTGACYGLKVWKEAVRVVRVFLTDNEDSDIQEQWSSQSGLRGEQKSRNLGLLYRIQTNMIYICHYWYREV